MKIGLFYGSTTCYTEIAAEKIRDAIGEELVDLFNIKETPLSKTQDYDVLILGISTWDYGELQEDWAELWQQLNGLTVQGKIIALYGMGDQEGYSQWFQDALGMLHDELLPQNPTFIGYTSVDGYKFEASKALTADASQFVGLALDEDNQYDLSDERIQNWAIQVLTEIQQHI
ncbi:flavodoxin FldB [Motilimonas sp. 1_MG-2023]|uniref:flavodoxin FldB n=1 Tax=Motilimonas sp. 1_MG-2023 TaxID=3062672 RepID=UPI0026E19D51|nr:flavodoxin FldB [Motilimonas sp. 1_MG-2023]MDO6524555.1 flavodoxin FldB [Motilimonas sp. 1_MG-2023]